MATFNLNTPNIPDEADILTQVRQIRSYITNLNNQLRYDLSNIDEDNLTGGELPENAISRGFRQKVHDLQGNMSVFEQTATRILARVENAEGDISTLEQAAQGLQTEVTNAKGDISGLQQTATGLQTQVNNLGNRNRTYLPGTVPSVSERVEGDLLIDTANGNILKRWNGSAWVAVQDGAISLAQQQADKIQWLVASGTSAANMTLTSQLYSLMAANIDLSANNSIKLAVSNVRVGGTNLISNSHFDINDSAGWVPRYSTIAVLNSELRNTFAEVHGAARLERIVDVPAPGTYTYTIFASTPQAINWKAFDGASVLSFTDTAASASYKVYSVVFQAFSAGPVTIRGYFENAPVGSVVYIDWETLRSGNASSGWDASQSDIAAYEYNHLVDSHFNGGSANGWSTLYGPVTVANSLLTKTIDTSIPATRIEKTLQIAKGGLYTFTIFAKTSRAINWGSFVKASIVAQSDGAASPSTFKKYSVTFFTNTDNSTVTLRAYMPDAPVGSTVVIDWEKLQLGAVATDWSDHYLDPASGVKTSKVTIDGTGIAMTTGGTFTTTSQNFNIDAAGNVVMKGTVEASAGKIGGFSLSSGKLIDTATSGSKMEIDPVNGVLDVGDFRITQLSSNIELFNQQTTGSSYIRILNTVGPISLAVENGPTDTTLSVHADNFYAVGGQFNVDSLYSQGNVSALSFTDRTPAYFGDALDELRWASGSKAKGIDHGSLPKFAQKTIIGTRINEDGEKEDYQEEGRDLGAMVSVLTRAVQQLADKVDSQQRLIEDLNRRVSA